MADRVKYFPPNDLFFGHNLSKIEIMQIPVFEEIDINDAIEFFQIERYFIAETRCKTWNDEAYEEYRKKSENLLSLAKRFFNQINDYNIIGLYSKIEFGYHSDFWVLFDNCKVFDKISSDTFENLINTDKISPTDLFSYKNIVCKYGNVLKNYIIKNKKCISILLRIYEQENTDGKKLILPAELTGEDICDYFENYIDGEHPNINYLRDIINMRCTAQFPITDEIRLKAKRRCEKETENLSKTGITFSNAIQISFTSDQEEERVITQKDHEISISYSTKWLSETLDYPSILNNFIYLFEFVDVPQMRCSHVHRMSQSGTLERALDSKSPKAYPHNIAFDFSNGLASMQMHAYYDFLEKQNIRLEDVIKWSFTEYIQSEFGCAQMRLSMPSFQSTYAEKCSSVITAFESVLKQYSVYVKNGNIDFDLIAMSTTPILFESVKSLVKDKYIYGVGKDYKRLSFWLFSDQCMFSFVERIHNEGRNYNRFIDLLLNETVYISDYRDDEREAFENMASYDLIDIGDDGKISLKNIAKLTIISDLVQHDVINKGHYPPDANDAISDFIDKGIIETKSTLFSRPEIDYLNYMLNREKYSNGPEIRNRYIHGIEQVNMNEDEHKENYFTLLRLFVLLAIKVNDDFCLREQNKDD